MKNLIALCVLLMPVFMPGLATAQEGIAWNAPGYAPEFKYMLEKSLQSSGSWEALAPDARRQALDSVQDKARARHAQMAEYNARTAQKWNARQLGTYIDSVSTAQVRAVSIWFGGEKASELRLKISFLRSMRSKAALRGLDDADMSELSRYLLPDAAAQLRYLNTAARSNGQGGAAGANGNLEQSASGNNLGSFAGAGSGALGPDELAEFYDGGAVSGGDTVVFSGNSRPAANTQTPRLNKAGVPPAAAGSASPPAPANAAPSPLREGAARRNKSSGIMSDAYGVTLYLAGSETPRIFRSGSEAAADIRRLRDGSVSRVIFYGHGSPGTMSVGPNYELDRKSAAALLRGKMAPGGVVQFSGCNTAGLCTRTSLNPFYGLSALARRLLYFSLPYFQERFEGRNAEESRRFWEAEWNKDLARDTSMGLRGSVVCGYRTFALVPERLPGICYITGRQEATSPAYVLGKKACYLNGSEVSAP